MHIKFYQTLFLLVCCVLALTTGLRAQNCDVGTFIVLDTQTDVDNFVCTSVTGSILIQSAVNDPITDLSPLQSIETVSGYIDIRALPALTNTDIEFTNLSTVGSFFGIQSSVAATTVSLPQLSSVGNGVFFDNNASLTAVSLPMLVSVASTGVVIRDNPLLTSIDVSSATSLPGITLQSNNSLTNVDGFSALTQLTGTLFVSNNSQLSGCCAFYELLSTPGSAGSVFIFSNDEGCNSRNEVEEVCAPEQSNDLCVNATVITCGSTTPGSTIDATTDGAPFCNISNTAPGVWYSLTPMENADITLSTCGQTDYDTKISVYTGDCDDLMCVVGNDDFCFPQSQVAFAATADQEYKILVHGFGGAAGDFELTAICETVGCTDIEAICPGPIVVDNDAGDCGAVVDFSASIGGDCPDATLTYSQQPGTFFPVGTTTVTVTATDASGNTDQCTFDVMVNDTEVPMVDCTAEIMVDNDPGLCEATIDLPVPDTSDNCGIVSFEYRFVAVDADNNEIGPFSDWFDVEAGATITLDVGRFRIRFRADDAAGNRDGCNQFVTVTDTEDPVITACAGTTVNFNGEDSFNSADVIDFAAMDNCEIVSTTFDPPLISCEDLGTTVVVTVTVTDAAGNSESCMANVVVDGLPCGFMLAEIGCQGDADYDVPTETFTLEATNCLYGNPFNQDELTYVKTELCGNGEIIAEVDEVEAFAWAGIMMRETLDQGSKKVALSRDNGNFARREARTATNGPAYPQQFPAFGKNWLRLVRNGNQFIGYVSPNGVQWQQVMVANISMDQCIYVGLFLTNKQPNQTVSADFRNVEVNQGHSGMSLQQLPATSLATPADVSVYPNPTAGLVTVDLGAFAEKDIQLDVRNSNGQVVLRRDLSRVSDQRAQLQLGHLPTGVYWLRVQVAGEAPRTERIVVQRP